ncbi:MAG TPA: type I-U CRISPR-associated RAMP protein Csb1/Cas7u [Solirubrobacterales bacterium]|nr:type I-U CRISPR-associated RAMP protein Csb1/Cas7u [Solirubrobacterales bacterium]
MIDALRDEPRLILKAKLKPVAGSAFQPTGFPDLGPAEFERPRADGETEQALLVESVQSLANRLEGVAWNKDEQRPATAVSSLPYVAVREKGSDHFLTSSRLEPHRLAGAYIRSSKIDGSGGDDWLIEKAGVEKGHPLNWRGLYRFLFDLDPLCLIHGVFFSSPKWRDYGNPRVRRAVTALIEAHGVRPVVSGGVKRDDVNPTTAEKRGSSEGFGFVPFGRTEYTARSIELDVVLDLEQLRGYGLGEEETDLLTAVALWEIRSLLDKPLRLRTACDLELDGEPQVTRPEGGRLPAGAEIEAAIASSKVSFDDGVPVVAEYETS